MDSLIYAAPVVLKKVDKENHHDIQLFSEIQNKLSRYHFLFDRSSSIRMPFHSYTDDKYKFPKIDSNSNSFVDACLQIVENIKKENNKVYIMWSGGIDSTMILVLFLMSNLDKDQLIVVCNSDSISEYYWFWKTFVKDKCKLMSTEKLMQYSKYHVLDGIVITGEPNDAFFGGSISNRLLDYFDIGFLHQPCTRENILKTTRFMRISNKSSNCFYDLMMATKQNSPRPIESVFDFYWWYGYNFMWMHNIEKLRARMHPDTDHRLFFAEDILQKWSLKNLTPIKYKLSYKDDYQLGIIYDYTGDKEYFKNKIKFESMSKIFQTYSALIRTQEKKSIYTNPNILDYYQPDNFISSWLLENQ